MIPVYIAGTALDIPLALIAAEVGVGGGGVAFGESDARIGNGGVLQMS